MLTRPDIPHAELRTGYKCLDVEKMRNMSIKIAKADYFNKKHAKEIPILLDRYASDPMAVENHLTKM